MNAWAQVQAELVGGTVVASIDGEVDLSNVPFVTQDLIRAVPPGARTVIVDLSKTTYLDSSGIRLLLEVMEQLATHRQAMRLVVPSHSAIQRLFAILAIGSVVPVYPTVEGALADSPTE